MRVIGGSLGGRQFDQPKTTATRPMSEKVRAALFDVLGSVSGLSVLDVFAGSGALGFEALSRGAKSVVAVEQSATVATTVRGNIQSLRLVESYRLIEQSVEHWLSGQGNARFDIVLADPPYEQLNIEILSKLGALLGTSGLLVVSHSSKISSPALQSLSLIKHKIYGDSALSFYRQVLPT